MRKKGRGSIICGWYIGMTGLLNFYFQVKNNRSYGEIMNHENLWDKMEIFRLRGHQHENTVLIISPTKKETNKQMFNKADYWNVKHWLLIRATILHDLATCDQSLVRHRATLRRATGRWATATCSSDGAPASLVSPEDVSGGAFQFLSWKPSKISKIMKI